MVDLKPHEYEANADFAPSATCASGKVQYPSFAGIYQIRMETDNFLTVFMNEGKENGRGF